MRYIIGQHDGNEFPFDRGMYRAYFYWQQDGVEHSRSYSIDELEAHIQRCVERGEPTTLLKTALEHLRLANEE